jgi:hypothetical protein
MNKHQMSLTVGFLFVFVGLAVGLDWAHKPNQGKLIGLGVLLVVYIGMMFMLKKNLTKMKPITIQMQLECCFLHGFPVTSAAIATVNAVMGGSTGGISRAVTYCESP